MGRLPNCIAKGCQNNRPHPANKNIYPVPSLSVLTDNPVTVDRGVSTEYTTEQAIPANNVYLGNAWKHISGLLLPSVLCFLYGALSTVNAKNHDTHKLTHAVDSSFRRRLQLSGSLGSAEGVGIKTMSLSPFRCRVFKICCASTSVTVPGMAEVSTVETIVDEIGDKIWQKEKGKLLGLGLQVI